MKESDIIHEAGRYWVCKVQNTYTVYRSGITHSTSDSSYRQDPDGLSIAVARANYLHRVNPTISSGK